VSHASRSPRLRIVSGWLGTLLAWFAITVLLAGGDSSGQSSTQSSERGSEQRSANSTSAKPMDSEPSVRIPSNVAWTVDVLRVASGGDAFHGLLLARRCNHCHGEEGFSSVPAFPNLAGLDQLSFWKQMQDFRSGKRASPVMQPIAEGISARDSADLAAYFAMLPTASDPQDNRVFPQAMREPPQASMAVRLIVFGDGRRGIPPCQSCHGPVSHVQGAPALAAQNGAYLEQQLQHFSDGNRTNDINVRMRSIARRLTAEEKTAVSDYYGAGFGSGVNSH
jgi:cytochrome c553